MEHLWQELKYRVKKNVQFQQTTIHQAIEEEWSKMSPKRTNKRVFLLTIE